MDKQTTFHDLKDRYHRDTIFRSLVDTLYAHMAHYKVSPYELRDAAYMASIQFAQMNIEPLVVKTRFPDEYMDILQSMGVRSTDN